MLRLGLLSFNNFVLGGGIKASCTSKAMSEHGDAKYKVKLEEISYESSETTKERKPCFRIADGFLEVDSEELDLERTLLGGQSFRWTKSDQPSGDDGQIVFTGVVRDHVLQLWRHSPTSIAFRKLNSASKLQDKKTDNKQIEGVLTDYFQLNYKLKDLYKQWSSKDSHLSTCCDFYKGFRILRQDPEENLFSFICATNNNIKRISQMIDKMCKHFGLELETCSDLERSETMHYSFPSTERLAQDDVFDLLRYKLGFGYRAKFITATAKQLLSMSGKSGARNYLLSLRELPYKKTCAQLMQFPGIGRKVADCICLMSMDHLESVPIDCHIYEIVCRHYLPDLRQKHKTLTESVHDLIGDHFKSLHGPLAGWSTSVLFIAELKHLKGDATSGSSAQNKRKKPSLVPRESGRKKSKN